MRPLQKKQLKSLKSSSRIPISNSNSHRLFSYSTSSSLGGYDVGRLSHQRPLTAHSLASIWRCCYTIAARAGLPAPAILTVKGLLMSGHSKWATIKHKKAATDAKRGKVFTKI